MTASQATSRDSQPGHDESKQGEGVSPEVTGSSAAAVLGTGGETNEEPKSGDGIAGPGSGDQAAGAPLTPSSAAAASATVASGDGAGDVDTGSNAPNTASESDQQTTQQAQQAAPPSEVSMVLSYLQKYGFANAASELQKILENEKKELDDKSKATSTTGDDDDGSKKRKREEGKEGETEQDGKQTLKRLPSIDYDVKEDLMDVDGDKTAASPENDSTLATPASGGDGAPISPGGGPEAAMLPISPTVNSNNSNNSNANSNNNILDAATGGGLGYDLDAAPAIAAWGAGYAPPSLKNQTISQYLLEGRSLDGVDFDSLQTQLESGVSGNETLKKLKKELIPIRDEARRYIEGFTSLVTWILTLPDDPANPILTNMMEGRPPFSSIQRNGFAEEVPEIVEEDGGKEGGEKKIIEDAKKAGDNEAETMEVDGDKPNQNASKVDKSSEEEPPSHQGLTTLIKHALAAAECNPTNQPNAVKPPAPNSLTLPLGATARIIPASSSATFQHDLLLLPPSTKHELLTLSFPLLVHTYCELLSCGLEHTAHALLDTYRHLYEPAHPTEIAELEKCHTTKSIVELNEDVMGQSSLQAEMRVVNGQIGLSNKKKVDLEGAIKALRGRVGLAKVSDEEKKRIKVALSEQEQQYSKLNETLSRLFAKLQELTSKNNMIVSKLSSLPFLRRARTLKWNITISTSAFGALTGFVCSRDDLLPMSALLQSRCHLIVERRDPMPFCPPAILEDMVLEDGKRNKKDKVRWAAPAHPITRAMEAGENISGVDGSQPHHKLSRSILAHSEALPFPKLRLEDGEDGDLDARAAVAFNRALLVNGFRRLEALELKREYESGLLRPSFHSNNNDGPGQRDIADPLAPSVLLGSLCSSVDADASVGTSSTSPWRESNIGITSASICPPDGRSVAVGCDDAAVRIWSMDRNTKESGSKPGSTSLGEPSMVLLGHKNGFPVFDVDWTRNGRTLLSAGGDGTIRLWDTKAVGPYGRLSNVMQQKNGSNTSKHAGGVSSASLNTVMVPGSKPEPMVEIGGAALAVYHGHAPSTPIWSVSSAPSGYYFASAGSDYTARIWATDRSTPVRVLSGHISPSVNCIAWHPNCNYVVTASDDKTCRMWDIQTGRCCRLLSGSTRGLNLVRVSPSGKYLAGAGYDNVVRIWDLGNGRMVNEFRAGGPHDSSAYSDGLIHSMAFSSCGAALAVAGEDCTVRIWDVRGAASHLSNPEYFAATRGPTATSSISDGFGRSVTTSQLGRFPLNEQARPGTRVPTRVFQTNNVAVLDLKYTKRNLLLAVGNYSG